MRNARDPATTTPASVRVSSLLSERVAVSVWNPRAKAYRHLHVQLEGCEFVSVIFLQAFGDS